MSGDRVLEEMAAGDAAWFELENPRNRPAVTAVLALAGRPSRSELLHTLSQVPLLQRRAARAGKRWVWTTHADGLEGNLVEEEGTLSALLARVLPEALDLGRPPWRAHLLQGADGTHLVVRLHHALGDGATLVSALLELVGSEEPSRSGSDPWTRVRRAVDVPRALLTILGRRDVRRIGEAVTGEKDVRLLGPYPLQALSTRGRAEGLTVNDLLTGAVGAALEEVAGPGLVAAAPLSLRTSPTGGNRFGVVLVPLPGGRVQGAAEEAGRRLRRLKRSGEAGATMLALRAAALVPQGAVRLLVTLLGSRANLVLSNVVGPPEPVELAGQAVTSMAFLVPQVGEVPLGVAILSYAGEVRIGVNLDRGAGLDVDVLAGALHRNMGALLE